MDSFKKYFQVIKNTLQEYFIYRFNFLVWRLRSVVKLLSIYFLWLAIFRRNQELLGYTQQLILTYILGTSVIRAITLSSRSVDVAGEIASGNLSNHLLKPISYFHFWFSKDLADKLLNLSLVSAELFLIFLLLKPHVFWQKNHFYLLSFAVSIILAMVLYFFLSSLIAMSTFWYGEHGGWPARFLFDVTIEVLAGGLFPLDILPKQLLFWLNFLPSTYLLFFPLKVYLGKMSPSAVFAGLILMVFWTFFLKSLVKFVWEKGLKVYEASGR